MLHPSRKIAQNLGRSIAKVYIVDVHSVCHCWFRVLKLLVTDWPGASLVIYGENRATNAAQVGTAKTFPEAASDGTTQSHGAMTVMDAIWPPLY